jgi:hypothetical protein
MTDKIALPFGQMSISEKEIRSLTDGGRGLEV